MLREQLESASPDLLRAIVKTFADALMSAEADAICGAPYGQRTGERVNQRMATGRGSGIPGPARSSWRSRSCARVASRPNYTHGRRLRLRQEWKPCVELLCDSSAYRGSFGRARSPEARCRATRAHGTGWHALVVYGGPRRYRREDVARERYR
ncbi:MAG: transposase [Micromonosporaceae bacterium]|nr:transposase [Micromonosporaceae bacterium]